MANQRAPWQTRTREETRRTPCRSHRRGRWWSKSKEQLTTSHQKRRTEWMEADSKIEREGPQKGSLNPTLTCPVKLLRDSNFHSIHCISLRKWVKLSPMHQFVASLGEHTIHSWQQVPSGFQSETHPEKNTSKGSNSFIIITCILWLLLFINFSGVYLNDSTSVHHHDLAHVFYTLEPERETTTE